MTTNYDATTFSSKQEQDAFNQACDEKETLTQPTKKEAPTMNVTVFTNQKEKYLPAWTKKCAAVHIDELENLLPLSNEVYADCYAEGKYTRTKDLVRIIINSKYFNLYNYKDSNFSNVITNLISVGNRVDVYDIYTHKIYKCASPHSTHVMAKRHQQCKYLMTYYSSLVTYAELEGVREYDYTMCDLATRLAKYYKSFNPNNWALPNVPKYARQLSCKRRALKENKIKSEVYSTLANKLIEQYQSFDARDWDTPTVDFSISNYILQDVMLDIQQDIALAELIANSAYTPVEHGVTEHALYEHDIIPNSVEVPDWHVQVNKEVTTFDRSKADRSKCVTNSVYFTDHNFNYSQQRVVTNKDMAIAQQHYEYLASHGLLEPTRDEKESRYIELKELLFTTSREDMLADTEYYFNLLVEYQELEAELGEFITSFFNLTF